MKNWKSNDVVTSQYEIPTDPFWMKNTVPWAGIELETEQSERWFISRGAPRRFIIQEQDYIGSSEEDSQATRNTKLYLEWRTGNPTM